MTMEHKCDSKFVQLQLKMSEKVTVKILIRENYCHMKETGYSIVP